jgi:hypothetical protein
MDTNMQTNIKYILAVVAAAAFMTAAFYLPAETFLAAFAGVLFLIPATFFVYMIQTVAKAGINENRFNEYPVDGRKNEILHGISCRITLAF